MLSNLREHKFGRKTAQIRTKVPSFVPKLRPITLDRTDFTRRVLIVVGFGYAHTKQAWL